MPQKSTAHAFLETLRAHGVKYVFANAGTDFAPIVEAIAERGGYDSKVPRFITVAHENVAVSMAQGYYQATGEIAAVMVHVNVGTANLVCGVMNSSRDRTPMLVMAGRTPLTESGHIASRNNGIHWGQENFDQGGMLREYVKWDYELRSGQPVSSIVGRALDIAMSEPRGPVYLTLPREVLSDTGVNAGPKPRRKSLGASHALPDASALEDAADILLKAKNPLIIAGRDGAIRGQAAAIGKFAKKFAIPVTQNGRLALPSDHPMNMGYAPQQLVPKADAILVVDSMVPWVPRMVSPKANAALIHISPDPLFSEIPFRGFEMDIALTGSSPATIDQLGKIMGRKAGKHKKAIATRANRLAKEKAAMLKDREKLLATAATQTPIAPAWIAHCVSKVKSKDAIFVSELSVPPAFMNMKDPENFIGTSVAGGLGSGLGMALGAKLARPDQDVILAVGDGSYIFGNPTAAHFVARAEELPTLTIVTNNHMWNAVKSSTLSMYPSGAAAKSNRVPLSHLDPSPDFEKIIESVGGYGEKVEDPAELEAAIRRALKAVRSGRPALLNVITAAGGRY